MASLNPADLCPNLLMAIIGPAPNNLIQGRWGEYPAVGGESGGAVKPAVGLPWDQEPTSAVRAGGRRGTEGTRCHLLAMNCS